MALKVVLDTNVFVHYLRAGLYEEWVAGRVEGTLRYLSSIVAMELGIGADTPRRRRAVAAVVEAHPAGRIVAPSPDLHVRGAAIFRALHGDGADLRDRLGPMNDILIALTAWSIGARLITLNEKDFRRIAPQLRGFAWSTP